MTRKKRIIYLVSNIDKALTFEWVAEFLDKQRFAVSFILLNPGDSELERYCRSTGIPVTRIRYRGKKDAPRAFFTIFAQFLLRRPDVVHCHLLHAHTLGVLAAWLAFIPNRIYTRHNATYHRQYYPNVVKFDAMANRLATCVVATSKNVKRVLVRDEGVPDRKVRIVRHGFDLEKFAAPNPRDVEALAVKYRTTGKYPVVGIIARYLDLKGLQYAIPAWKRLRQNFPNSHLVLANAHGPFAEEVECLLSDIPTSDYTEVPFESNNYALYHLFDIYLHVPINSEIEAFGQTYVEALACGTPSVFTMSGIAPEFIRNEHNALVVPFEESDPIYEAMKRLLSDKKLREQLIAQGRADVKQFDITVMISQLESLYSQ